MRQQTNCYGSLNSTSVLARILVLLAQVMILVVWPKHESLSSLLVLNREGLAKMRANTVSHMLSDAAYRLYIAILQIKGVQASASQQG